YCFVDMDPKHVQVFPSRSSGPFVHAAIRREPFRAESRLCCENVLGAALGVDFLYKEETEVFGTNVKASTLASIKDVRCKLTVSNVAASSFLYDVGLLCPTVFCPGPEHVVVPEVGVPDPNLLTV